MPFQAEIQERILKRLQERIPNIGSCALCRTEGWILSNGFVFSVLQDDLDKTRQFGEGQPLVTLTCKHCGNTHFLNLLVLGLGDTIKKEAVVK